LCTATGRHGIQANPLKRRAFEPCAIAIVQRNTLQQPGLNIDGMSNRKKRKFSFETL
jgi:hypothetical protein